MCLCATYDVAIRLSPQTTSLAGESAVISVTAFDVGSYHGNTPDPDPNHVGQWTAVVAVAHHGGSTYTATLYTDTTSLQRYAPTFMAVLAGWRWS